MFAVPGRGELAPHRLRLYANYPNIVDFGDAEVTKPHLNIALLEGERGVVEYPLRVAAFTSVVSLSLYFVSIPYPLQLRARPPHATGAEQFRRRRLISRVLCWI